MSKAMATVFDWEQAVREDPRPRQIDALVQKILAKNFPEPVPEMPPRYRNAPPIIPQSAMPAPVASVVAAPESSPSEREFVNVRDYQSESASDHTPTREVDPMDELSDFEQPNGTPEPPRPASAPAPVAVAQVVAMADEAPPPPPPPPREEQGTNGGDFDMEDTSVGADDGEPGEAQGGEEDEEHAPTACVICNSDANDDQTLLCDGCDKEYHLYCLNPPLQTVPTDDWFCPDCQPARTVGTAPATTAATPPVAPVAVKAESTAPPPAPAPVQSAAAPTPTPVSAPASVPAAPVANTAASAAQPVSSSLHIKQEQSMNGSTTATPPISSTQASRPPQPSIVESLEQDAERSNQLLIHACQCDEQQCRHASFQYICPHMKRFLRSACWASHSDTWRTYRVATVTAELFAYHALRCQVPSCSVPMCEQLRAEEYV